MKLNLKGVNKATWVRIIGLLIILINQVAITIFDFQLLNFTDEQIYEGISTILTIVIAVAAGWKNNSITEAGQKADKVLKEEKRKGL